MSEPSLDDLFERRLTYPDLGAQRRYRNLIGLDAPKARLEKLLAILVSPAGLEGWVAKHHRDAKGLLEILLSRPPLIVLAGDVGTGKTELAETIGDAVARHEQIGITLFPMSLSTRGSGRVGEMTKLLSSAFECTLDAARKLSRQKGKSSGAVILLVDEGDALTQSRESGQMHHEDRAGVNAFIRGVDKLAEQRLPAAVILCTNRLSAIDPAVQRRAAEIFIFARPNNEQRRAVINRALQPAGLTSDQIDRLVKATGPTNGIDYGFTYSDLTQRLIPTLVLDAYPDRALQFDRIMALASELRATPPFRQGA